MPVGEFSLETLVVGDIVDIKGDALDLQARVVRASMHPACIFFDPGTNQVSVGQLLGTIAFQGMVDEPLEIFFDGSLIRDVGMLVYVTIGDGSIVHASGTLSKFVVKREGEIIAES